MNNHREAGRNIVGKYIYLHFNGIIQDFGKGLTVMCVLSIPYIMGTKCPQEQ